MSSYTKLTQEQRYQIQTLMKAGHNHSEIVKIDRDSGLGLLDRFDDRMFTVLAFSHDTLLYGEDHAIFYLCCVRL